MLKWYYYVLFAVVTVVALSMTWYSMMDLGTEILSLPVALSAAVSVAFDGGGIFLGLLSIQYAKSQDSGFWTEVGAFLFIGTGAYIVVQHAILESYPAAGIVMFAAAPIIVGVMLKSLLGYLTRQSRRESGRIVEKLPSVGWFTWMRYRRQSWGLMSVAMRQRIINAAGRLDMAEDKYGIFGDTATKKLDMSQDTVPVVQATVGQVVDNRRTPLGQSETRKDIVLGVVPPVLEMSQQMSHFSGTEMRHEDNFVLPPWMPHEPTMSVSKIVSTCMDNNATDFGQILDIARTLKGHSVNQHTVRKAMYRVIAKEQGLV